MTHRTRWRFGALASAVALLGSLASIEAHALALGRVTVQSALGEALRAEIDIAEINAEEASSLRVGIASSEAFRAAGLEYSATVVGVQISLQKRPDGRSFLRLSSPRPVTEPFVDLVVEANWASGRVVRDYTMLFDPPTLRQANNSSAPALGSAPVPVPSRRAALAPTPAPAPAADAQSPRPVPMAKPPRQRVEQAQKPQSSGQQVTVRPGDTASKIAGSNKAAGVSLDQMLVALLQSNPDAFIGGNVNRLRSGAVLNLPSEETAAAMSAGQASQTIIAQSKDFNNFRRRLAEGAPAAQVAGAGRTADGKLQAKVDDNASGAKTPDKLTLSKGAIQSKALAEEKIAKDRQALAESTRVAELSKNIGDLKKLTGTPTAAVSAVPAAPAVPTSAAKAPGVPIPVPVPVPVPAAATQAPTVPAVPVPVPVPVLTASAPAVVASASQPAANTPIAAASAPTVAATATASSALTASPTTSATTGTTAPAVAASSMAAPAVVASAAAPAPAAKAVVAPPPPPEPSFIDELIGNQFALPALGGLLALLGGLAFYQRRKKNNPPAVDSSFLESRLQPDSFFGASGGQRVDTSESSASGSSLVYSPSQLDAAGDVDPVAEADVYLAYGRDLQAEEILKEALRTTPARVAIHAKLAEIYSKRRDLKSLESIATEAFGLTTGNGPEWSYITELGREIDPANALYMPGGQPAASPPTALAKSAALAAAFGSDTIPVPHAVNDADKASASKDVDFDLDLDFSAGDAASASQSAATPAKVEVVAPTVAAFNGSSPPPTISMDMDPTPMFDSGSMDFDDVKLATQPIAIKAVPNAVSATFSSTQPLVAIKPAATPAAPPVMLDSGMMEFDMGSLSLDLDAQTTASSVLSKASGGFVPEGPLETKFALAEEFRALGDPDGARSLANEVAAQAQGALKIKAQAFLNSLM